MKQEAADTKYSMKHKESNIEKETNPSEYERAERGLGIRAVGLVGSCGRCSVRHE